ncbi:MAG TPA: CaiB/BaiF CoA-transferase family protein [Burkholderiales bacterium]|jgi:formyl-CoA transferase|nr:CaiB/BaiF CoA-transferase family protein [Burkholderiales bacterium]
MADSFGPLAGLKVLELGQLIAGPFAGKFFSDFGAEVIKIEPPADEKSQGGDPIRYWRTMHEGTSLWWHVQSRGKKSVTVNLRLPEGQEIVRKLAAEADIVIENFRPGTLEKWGLGYDDLAKVNPGVILMRVSGFGQTGPMRDLAGFGTVAESMGGMRYVSGFPDRPPVRMNLSIGDAIASLHGVIGVLMCLHHKNQTGQGQVVDVALYESVFNMMESTLPEYGATGQVRERTGTNLTGIVPSNTYTSKDGVHIVIGGNGDSIFKRLMSTIERDDLGNDPGLAINSGRAQRAQELDDAIQAWCGANEAEFILKALNDAQVPNGKIYSIADIAQDPQYLAREMIQTVHLKDGMELKVPGVVPRLSKTPGRVNGVGPDLGEHNQGVLASLGYTAEQIAALKANKAI